MGPTWSDDARENHPSVAAFFCTVEVAEAFFPCGGHVCCGRACTAPGKACCGRSPGTQLCGSAQHPRGSRPFVACNVDKRSGKTSEKAVHCAECRSLVRGNGIKFATSRSGSSASPPVSAASWPLGRPAARPVSPWRGPRSAGSSAWRRCGSPGATPRPSGWGSGAPPAAPGRRRREKRSLT